MLSMQCDCHNLLITLITGLCLQHLTALCEVRFAILLWPVVRLGLHLPKLSYKIQVTDFLAHIVDIYAVDNIIINSNNGDKTTSGLSAVLFLVCSSARSAT